MYGWRVQDAYESTHAACLQHYVSATTGYDWALCALHPRMANKTWRLSISASASPGCCSTEELQPAGRPPLLAALPPSIVLLASQVGGCRAQRSWVSALSWAASPAPPSPPPSPPSHQPHDHLHQQDELLLISGSSDGCLRLHSQSVRALGAAKGQGAGALLGGEVLQLRKTLHEVDLLGVTCVSVKLAEATSVGELMDCMMAQPPFCSLVYDC